MGKMKGKVVKQRAEPGLLRLHHLLRGLILLMLAIVSYDAIVHQIPLYYMVFVFAGLIVGRGFSLTQRIERKKDTGKFSVSTSRLSIVLLLLLLSFRFIFGKTLLEKVHVVWASDALYLFFIGVYWSRWKNLIRQIDGLVYLWADKKLTDQNEKE